MGQHILFLDQTEERPPHPRRCTATSKRSGKRCGKYAMKAQTTCAFHGGKASRALANAQRAVEAADLRVRGLTPEAVEVLKELLHANSESVVLGAVKDILDRGGLKAAHRIQVDSEITVVRPW